MNEQKVRNEVEKLTKDNPYRQYPANKAQTAKLAELGLTEMMPQRFIGGGRYGIGNLDAQKVIAAAEDAGGLSGGWTSYGDGDVVRVGASALYRLLHAEPEDDAPDPDDDPDDDPEEDYEADPADEALDRLIDEVAALEQRRFEEAGLAEMAKEMAEEIAASELRPLKAFEHLASPDTLRRAAWQGRLVAEKIGRDWFTDEYAVRAYLKHTRARRSRRVEQPVTFVNLTPHAITVRRQDGTELNIPPAGQVARCEEQRTDCGSVDGIAVSTARYGAVDGLPEPQPGTFYIVSGLVLAAVGDRRADVFAPGPAQRDGEGRIVACDGLSAGPAFAGRR